MIRVLVAALFAAVVSTPQAAVDDLMAGDRSFSAASAQTDLVSGLTAMFAGDVVIPMPPGKFVTGKAAVIDALKANPDNLTSRTEWTPVRGGISADGQHGFTLGYMIIHRADHTDLPLKYLAYWVKHPEGWRVAVYKRARANTAPVSVDTMTPVVPATLVTATASAEAIAKARASLDEAERAFSSTAQKVGLRAAFVQFGSADAINLGRVDDRSIVIGSRNIAQMVGEGLAPGESSVSWAPERVIVASSGDLGVTIGWIRPNAPAPDRAAQSPFFTIWRRADANAPWKYVAE